MAIMRINVIIRGLTLILLFSTVIVSAKTVIDDSENQTYLFTLAGKSGTFADNVLTLNDAPLVIYFADRPVRKAGHLTLEQFANLWDSGENAFEKDPPSGQLSISEESDKDESGIGHAVVILEKPKVKGDSISFKVSIIDGDIPATFEKATVYIDSLGVKKSPSF